MKNQTGQKIKTGFTRAAKITRRYAKSFYFASLFLTREKRNAAYSIYAICRLSDEATDKDASLIELSTAKRNIDAVYSGKELNMSILLSFKESVNNYSIPRHYFDELIDGMYMDFNKNRYKDFSELKTYCYRVAGVVGLMMLQIFGFKDFEAKNYDVNMGIAMQLTNILRDLKEDFKRGRIYLPQEEMASFGVSENDIAKAIVNDNFKLMLKFQIDRTRRFYEDSEPGIMMITDSRCRFVAWVMKEVYSGILDEIEKNNYDVFSKRAYVGLWGKLTRVFRAYRRSRKNEN